MVLTFDYPWHRKNIFDRRLLSDINRSLQIQKKNDALENVLVKVVIYKRVNLLYKTRSLKYNLAHRKYYSNRKIYFNEQQLKDIVNIVLNKCNLRLNIKQYLFIEKLIYGSSSIELEFFPEEVRNEVHGF